MSSKFKIKISIATVTHLLFLFNHITFRFFVCVCATYTNIVCCPSVGHKSACNNY